MRRTLLLLPLLAACAVPASDARDGGAPDNSRADAVTATPARVTLDDAITPLSRITAVGAAPILAFSPDGRRATAWVSAPDGGSDGRLYVSVADAAGTFGPAVEVRDPLGPIEAHGEAPPKLAWAVTPTREATLGALYVVGKLVPGRRFPASSLRFVRSRDGGRTWSAPVTVTDDSTGARALDRDFGSFNFHALHAAPDGTLHAAWLDGRHGASAVYTTHSRDGGTTWAPNVRVVPATSGAAEACPCCRTAIAANGRGTVYLAWRAVLPAEAPDASLALTGARAGDDHAAHAGHASSSDRAGAPPPARRTIRDIVVARSDDGGAHWGAPVRIATDDWVFDGCPHAGPSLAIDAEDRLHVAWWTGKPEAAGVYYTRSRDGGAAFSPPTPLGVAEQSRPAHVQLAQLARPGAAPAIVAVWDDGTRSTPQVVVRASLDGGDSFAPAVAVSDPTQAAAFPVLGLQRAGASDGELFIAWSEQAAADAEAAARARPDMRNPNAQMGLPQVGRTQVLVRRGRLSGDGEVTVAAETGAFRAVQVGDVAPAYGAAVVHGDGAGTRVELGDGTLTLVNVWATWCTACREEMADLDSLHRAYGARGLRVLGVSVDKVPRDRVLGFVRKERLGFRIAHDPENRIGEQLGVVGVPETYLIDGNGRVRWKLAGNVHGQLDEARAAIEAALPR
jgi:peroxiredoxin